MVAAGGRKRRSRGSLFAILACFLCWRHLPRVGGQKPSHSVAVIGAGIGGSTASYNLRELLGDGAEIVVFERAVKAGGRTDHFMHDGRALETGAAIIYSGNQYLFDLTERVNLTRVNEVKSEGPNTGLWDGEQFVLTTTNWGLANLARMAWRYGMSLLSLRFMVHDALAKFLRLYDLQASGRVFETPEELWGEVGLLDLTRMTIADHFERRLGRAGSLVEKELGHAAMRVNYNQGNSLNALAGLVSLCPAVVGDLFQVEGGNSRLSEELLRASATEVRLNTTVARVAGSARQGYSLYDSDRLEKLGTFDALIIATPLTLAGIALDVRGEDGTSEPLRKPLPVVDYQEVHTTFVRGVVDRKYFGLGPQDAVPATVLVTESAADLAFSSLRLHSWVGDPSGGVGIYKLFSRQELWTGALDAVFVKGSWEILHHREWNAYPVLNPRQEFSPALLFTGHPVWYVSSLEEGVSAMEISAISAKNAALGVARALLPKQGVQNVVDPGRGAPNNAHGAGVEL